MNLVKSMYFTVGILVLLILLLQFWLTRKTLLQPAHDWSIRNRSLTTHQKQLLYFIKLLSSWVVDLGSNLSLWPQAEVMFFLTIKNEGTLCTTNIILAVRKTFFICNSQLWSCDVISLKMRASWSDTFGLKILVWCLSRSIA